jgi:hypothetical protein
MENTRRSFIKYCGLGVACFFSLPYLKSAAYLRPQELSDLLTDENGLPIDTLKKWLQNRKIIKESWSSFLGIISDDHSVPSVRVLSEEVANGVIRQYVEYENEPGIRVNAYILKPEKSGKPLPGVVALHSTSDNLMKYIAGVEKGEIPPSGYNLAKLGFVVICPQCFLWRDKGERSWEEQATRFLQSHPGSKGISIMLHDAMRAVDVLSGIPEVDPLRIGVMGHSLGGKEALYLGAFDDRVKAIVSNEGGIGIDFSNWDASWYLGKEIHNFGRQHHELLALCAPRPFLLIGGNSADGEKSLAYINAVKPVYELFGEVQNLQFYNHGKGHNIVPESDKMTFEWLIRYLRE